MNHIIQDTIFSLIRNTLGKFIQPQLLAVPNEEMVLLEFSDIENQVENCNLLMGFMTRQLLHESLSLDFAVMYATSTLLQ